MAIVTIAELGSGLPHLFEVAEDAAWRACSLNVRLKRSTTLLVWGSATKAKLVA